MGSSWNQCNFVPDFHRPHPSEHRKRSLPAIRYRAISYGLHSSNHSIRYPAANHRWCISMSSKLSLLHPITPGSDRAIPSLQRCACHNIKIDSYLGQSFWGSNKEESSVRFASCLAGGFCLILHSRVLTKGTSAEVEISLRAGTLSGPALSARPIPLEAFSVNKDMGRILVRRGGETISAGKPLAIVAVKILNTLVGIVQNIIC